MGNGDGGFPDWKFNTYRLTAWDLSVVVAPSASPVGRRTSGLDAWTAELAVSPWPASARLPRPPAPPHCEGLLLGICRGDRDCEVTRMGERERAIHFCEPLKAWDGSKQADGLFDNLLLGCENLGWPKTKAILLGYLLDCGKRYFGPRLGPQPYWP
jgi:hypothetical protein